jgi:vancomycin resistance protein VanJ
MPAQRLSPSPIVRIRCAARGRVSNPVERARASGRHTPVRKGLPFLPELALFACVAPLVVRLAFRDSVPGLATLTYATPVCLLAGLAVVACALAWQARKPRLARASGVLALALGVWTLAANVSLHAPGQGGRYRGLLWNVEGGHRGWDRVAAHVRRQNPDLAAFIDVGHTTGIRSPAMNAALGDRAVYWWNDALALAVRGRIIDARYESLGFGSHAGIAHVELDGRPLTVVVVHPRSTPTQSRAGAFAALHELLEPLKGEPLLVMGDFNTPSDSVFFDPIRQRFHSAFETAGLGYAASWPMPFPVLALDQVWSADSVPIRSCHLAGSTASDHRLVSFSFD